MAQIVNQTFGIWENWINCENCGRWSIAKINLFDLAKICEK